jgi:hypothetical protein
MNSSELIKIDYSEHFQDDDIVHAKVIKKPIYRKKNKFISHSNNFDIEINNDFLDSKRALPTIDRNTFDYKRYIDFKINKSKVVTKELEKHLIRSVVF